MRVLRLIRFAVQCTCPYYSAASVAKKKKEQYTTLWSHSNRNELIEKKKLRLEREREQQKKKYIDCHFYPLASSRLLHHVPILILPTLHYVIIHTFSLFHHTSVQRVYAPTTTRYASQPRSWACERISIFLRVHFFYSLLLSIALLSSRCFYFFSFLSYICKISETKHQQRQQKKDPHLRRISDIRISYRFSHVWNITGIPTICAVHVDLFCICIYKLYSSV